MQFRMHGRHERPALIVHDVPMKYVEFVVCHRIQMRQNGGHWEIVARRVHHQTSIRKGGPIQNGGCVHSILALFCPMNQIGRVHQLTERFESTKSAPDTVGQQERLRPVRLVADAQLIRLVHSRMRILAIAPISYLHVQLLQYLDIVRRTSSVEIARIVCVR